MRLPANQLEDLVISELRSLLANGARLLDTLAPKSMPGFQQDLLIRAGQNLADAWPNLSLPKQIALIRAWQPRIIVGQCQVTIEMRKQNLAASLLEGRHAEEDDTGTTLQIDIPVQLKRSGIETRLVVTNNQPVPQHRESTVSLQKALQKALSWKQQLLRGKAKTMAEVAQKEGVTQRFIAQRIQLAYLAPDIMQRIIAGDAPDTLNLEAFKNRRIPLDWQEQHRYFQLAG